MSIASVHLYGAVSLVVQDNGGKFVNAIMNHLAKLIGIQD